MKKARLRRIIRDSKRKADALIKNTAEVRYRITGDISELAAKVSNDIAEDIDCGEDRETLREIIRWFANRHCEQAQMAADLKGKWIMLQCAFRLLKATSEFKAVDVKLKD